MNRSSPTRADERGIQQLDRRAPFEPAVAALRQPHAAHPTLTEPFEQRVCPDGVAGKRWRRRRHRRAAFEEPLVLNQIELDQQGLEVSGQPGIVRTERGEPRGALCDAHLHRVVEMGAEKMPAGGVEP